MTTHMHVVGDAQLRLVLDVERHMATNHLGELGVHN